MGSRPDHRGAGEDIASFARDFVLARLGGFEKDMIICLTGGRREGDKRRTHAYFPALSSACGFMEYLSALHFGSVSNVGYQQAATWCERYMPQPSYDAETVRLLFLAFRNSVNHRGIASGVWVDPHPQRNRRITWRIRANSRDPAIILVREPGVLTRAC